MKIDKSVFKAYDIRGVYPEQINKGFAYGLGRALAYFLQKNSQKKKIKLVVGQDMRESSPDLFKELIKGLTEQGADVCDVGIVSTPTFYFIVAKDGYDGGVQISASHNPAEYNGFKMVKTEAVPLSGDKGIKRLAEIMEKEEYNKTESRGQLTQKEKATQEHVNYSLTWGDPDKIKPYKVVVDAANSVGAPMFEKLFSELPCELVKLNFELDGTFPAHEADPLKDENNHQLQQKVLEVKADLGISLDGDGDRIFFIDNTGQTIDPAIVRGILSKIFLADNPGASICYDIRPGKITVDMIEQAGGKPVVTRVGHSLIKEKAKEVEAVFAGESSGHFFVKLPFGIFEMPMIVALKLLQYFSASDKSVAEQVKPFYKYYHSGEINFSVEDKQAVFERLKKEFKNNLKYDFDGVSFEWSDWWFNVRPSNTENKVRLNLEAVSEEIMLDNLKKVKKVIQG